MRNNLIVYSISRVVVTVFLFFIVLLIAQPAFASEQYFTNERVNLRSGPGTEYKRHKTLSIGTEVQVIEYDADEWSKVIYNDITGYIKSEFLSELRPESPESSSPVSQGGVAAVTWDEAKNIIKIGVPMSVYDVYSGLTYNVKSFSNGLHADVEPITVEDTAIMKRTYGGSWSWSPRPVWVTVGDITLAAAINGMPHGGGVNSNNGMAGQVCLHFIGSKVHNGNTKYNNDMQAAVWTAFEMAE